MRRGKKGKTMNPGIFREYDIRGIAGKDMIEEDVANIGKGVGTYLRQHGCSQLSVGRDCRMSSDAYAEKIIEGLRSTGCDVTDIGVLPHAGILFFHSTPEKRRRCDGNSQP